MSLLLSLVLALSGDPASGPQVGDSLKELKLLGHAGPQAGKEFELTADLKDNVSLIVFVHQLTRPGLKLLRPLDEFAAKETKLKTHYIWLNDDKEKMGEFLKRAENSLALRSPSSIGLDGKLGPDTYGLNDRVMMTVLITRGSRVVGNLALVDPNETDARRILEAAKKALEK